MRDDGVSYWLDMGGRSESPASLEANAVPRGSYPTPFLGYLVLWLGSVILKSRRPKKGVGYEPLGRAEVSGFRSKVEDSGGGGVRV